MGKDAKKAVVSDEWRNKNVEERLEFSLIKVCTSRHHTVWEMSSMLSYRVYVLRYCKPTFLFVMTGRDFDSDKQVCINEFFQPSLISKKYRY